MVSHGYKSILAGHGLRFSRSEGNVRVAEKSYGEDRITVTANLYPNGKLRSISIEVDADGSWGTFMRREADVIANAIKHDKPGLPITCSVV